MAEAYSADEILIAEVQKLEFLYNYKHKHHKNRVMRFNAWNSIATIVGYSASDCEKRFRTLRDRYRRYRLKKLRNGSSVIQPFPLYQNLRFLEDHITERTSKWTVTVPNVAGTKENTPSYSCNTDSDVSLIDPCDDSSDFFGQESSSHVVAEYLENEDNSSEIDDTPFETQITADICDAAQASEGGKKKTRTSEKLCNNSKSEPEMSPVDHLMMYIGNSIKEYPKEKQDEACKMLMNSFFEIKDKLK